MVGQSPDTTSATQATPNTKSQHTQRHWWHKTKRFHHDIINILSSPHIVVCFNLVKDRGKNNKRITCAINLGNRPTTIAECGFRQTFEGKTSIFAGLQFPLYQPKRFFFLWLLVPLFRVPAHAMIHTNRNALHPKSMSLTEVAV